MRFGVEQFLFPEGRRCKKELFYSKSHFSLHVEAKQWRHIVWFHKHKIELKYVLIRLEMLSSKYILVKLVEMNIFHVNYKRGALCLSQGRRMGYPAWGTNKQKSIDGLSEGWVTMPPSVALMWPTGNCGLTGNSFVVASRRFDCKYHTKLWNVGSYAT